MQDFNQRSEAMQGGGFALPQIDLAPVMRQVYTWMGLGLLVTALAAFFLSSTGIVINPVIMIVAIIAQFGLVLFLSARIAKMNPQTALTMFFVYAALNGVTFSIIFLAYPVASIANAFLTTAGLFGAMTFIGYTTKTDLTKMGWFLMMALIGMIIAMVVNIFLGSTMLDFIISVVGVLVFTGLTAYDTQKIKRMASDPNIVGDQTNASRLAIMGALTLYLDFINLFLFLLQLFGGRD